MSGRGFSTYLCLFFTSLICCYEAMPAELFQAPVNDRPVIGKKLSLGVLHVKKSNETGLSLLCFDFLCVLFCHAGVLTQVVSDEIMKPFGRTYIPDSYVNYIESGGSRVMPIRWVEGAFVCEDGNKRATKAFYNAGYSRLPICRFLKKLFNSVKDWQPGSTPSFTSG